MDAHILEWFDSEAWSPNLPYVTGVDSNTYFEKWSLSVMSSFDSSLIKHPMYVGVPNIFLIKCVYVEDIQS